MVMTSVAPAAADLDNGGVLLAAAEFDAMCDGAHGAPLVPWPNRLDTQVVRDAPRVGTRRFRWRRDTHSR